LLRPCGPAAWRFKFKRLYPASHDAAYDAHVAETMAYLRKPDHWRAFQVTAGTSHDPTEARLGKIHAPTLIVMGAMEPDFPDPEMEAR